MTFRRQLAAQLCRRVCGFIRHYSKDLSPLVQHEANHYETGDFYAENHKHCVLSQCCKAIGSVFSVITLIGMISFLIFGDRKGEEGREKMSCLGNLPPLTKLEVSGYFSANEKKEMR